MVKDYQIFKETINNTISNSGLDVGVVYYILKDTFREVENLYYAQINKELMEESKSDNKSTIDSNTEKQEETEV